MSYNTVNGTAVNEDGLTSHSIMPTWDAPHYPIWIERGNSLCTLQDRWKSFIITSGEIFNTALC